MSHPACPPEIAKLVDEWITDDGEPFEDGLGIITYVLERALGPARGGYGTSEHNELLEVAEHLVTVSDVTIDGVSEDPYDEDEPVAHIVQALEKLAAVPGTPVINNMLMVAESAMRIAREWAKVGEEGRAAHIGNIEDLITRQINED